MTWNLDIIAAPHGKTVTVTETDKDGQPKEREEFRHEPVWLWTKCGKKVLTKWLPPSRFTPKGRWDGLATTEEPIAWHPFFTPADPVFPSAQHEAAHLPIIEDVGGM